MTLKHVVDNFFSYRPIQNFDGSTQESIYLDFLEAGNNSNLQFQPEDEWSDVWLDWHKRCEPKEIPLRHTQIIDLENTCANPAPLQPAKTEQLVTNELFFISNEKFYCWMRSEGRGYQFCDRFCPEVLYEVTQTGDSLANVETRVKVRGRFRVKKYIGPFQSVIMRVAEP